MSAQQLLRGPGHAISAALRRREVTVTSVVDAAIARVQATDRRVNAFTQLTLQRALTRAAALDARLAGGDTTAQALPLLGVPVAVKTLFDIVGITTLAGSVIERDRPPARADAVLLQRLECAGAVLLGALNMDEYAYGFTTENSHYGPTRNPHDLTRLSGGSSGGSAAAVAAGQVPLTLGSDTNGSIRVPASLCGVFGLKPTFGRLPRTGSYPFVASIDHLGPFARSVRDLALAYDAMQGHDAADPFNVARPVEPTVAQLDGLGGLPRGLRIGVLGGWFREMALPEARDAVDRVAAALGATRELSWPEVARGRAAAFLISNAEGAALHLPDLRTRASDFEPLSRDRFLAGALIPAPWLVQAHRVRRWFAQRVAESLAEVDVLLAPATPCAAPLIGSEWLDVGGQRLPARASMGLLTQPVSCVGLPVCAVPVWGAHASLPVGVQIIAAPWREDRVLAVAAALESMGVARAPLAPLE